ncbi:hypothetical protein [Paludisphaera mucosa]|uniref:Uncharacterized protein n=1 Tax=Paludisphaera mucosa TaxID=3030827 RepID=A0ABT6FE37_9BACT|nr:hypothetical protein [Paludisphaera mucosa]MDG3005838.1 hypothetical protein [Paludisphaera mucosa]
MLDDAVRLCMGIHGRAGSRYTPAMAASISSYALVGLDAVPVEVLIHADLVRVICRETGEVLAARTREPASSQQRSAPADLKKDAGGFDLPIALEILAASGRSPWTGRGTSRWWVS